MVNSNALRRAWWACYGSDIIQFGHTTSDVVSGVNYIPSYVRLAMQLH